MHAKHRERIRKRLVENPNSFAEHELLETLLFYSLPRVNTNPIAHDLIKRYGTLEKVFNASVESLMQSKGIGENTAVYLRVVGQTINYIAKNTKPSEMMCFDKVRSSIQKSFMGMSEEVFIVFFVNNSNRVIAKSILCNHSKFEVSVDMQSIAKEVLNHKPQYVVVAHNHLSGICRPTDADDQTTRKLHKMLDTLGVTLADHIIVTKKEVFSYYVSGQLDKCLNKYVYVIDDSDDDDSIF